MLCVGQYLPHLSADLMADIYQCWENVKCSKTEKNRKSCSIWQKFVLSVKKTQKVPSSHRHSDVTRTGIQKHQPGKKIIYYNDFEWHIGIIAQGGYYPSAFDKDVFSQSSVQIQIKPLT